MPIGSEFLGDGWRDASIPGLPPLQVRRPVMRDMATAGGNQYWWVECVRCADGSRLLPDGVAAADLQVEIGNAIIAEVMKDRFTQAPKGAYGA